MRAAFNQVNTVFISLPFFFLQKAGFALETAIQEFKNASSTDVDDERVKNAHFLTIALEDFAVRFAQEQLNETNPQFHDHADIVGQ